MNENEILATLVIAGCFALVFVLLAAVVALMIYTHHNGTAGRFPVRYERDTDFL